MSTPFLRSTFLMLILVVLASSSVLAHQPPKVSDVYRPITELTENSFTIQWFTPEPSESRLMLRQGDVTMVAWRPEEMRADPWESDVRMVEGPAGLRTFHHLTVDGLEPGKRYFYRLYDPTAEPTDYEKSFGAAPPWGREYAVATRAADGQRTIIRLPVKVLLIPNVLDLASAHPEDGEAAPLPEKLTEDELQLLRDEYASSALYFFVNSGLRLWVDYDIFIDERWQRWGEEPEGAEEDYRDWPLSRNYPGDGPRWPGGGGFTILDTQEIERHNTDPVYEERPYAGQIEQAFLRRWNAEKREWTFVGSGGATFGPDRFGRGEPGRSQYLGGGDTAWLATHEFHHQLEGLSRVSFPHAEHDRIVFNHPEIRRRVEQEDGETLYNAWTTAGRHGGHWDVMAYWMRTLTEVQWLHIYLGEVLTVTDADNDGVPDDDARLPLDERRFGSNPANATTDGRMNDREKIMLGTWAPAPLQPTWIKPRDLLMRPDPTRTDSSGDGIDDADSPYPLYPYPPFVWPKKMTIDGDASDWAGVPTTGVTEHDHVRLVFKHAYDDEAYRGLLLMEGDWRRVMITLDGEGDGIFSGRGVVEFNVVRNPVSGAAAGGGDEAAVQDPEEPAVNVRPTGFGAAGLEWSADRDEGGRTVFEFSIPNRAGPGGEEKEGDWFWRGGGREVGVALEITDTDGRIYSVYEPYRLFYCRMLPIHGQPR
jgi:hypothetical protein